MNPLHHICEERVTFCAGDLALSGVLGYPETGHPRSAVLLCSPHPNFAGDMNNNVVSALATEMARHALVLRFDYRGVGQSQINLPAGQSLYDYWQELEDSHDYSPVIAEVQSAAQFLRQTAGNIPLHVVGYSFGAAVGLAYAQTNPEVARMVGIAPPIKRVDFRFLVRIARPCLLLAGDNDFVCDGEEMRSLTAACPDAVQSRVLPGEDHFFRGHEIELARIVAEFLFASEGGLK